ncbi:hypothetical protein [Psychromonas sp.]|uniref:hypothetical protein n=1 Tax=Psychromonas sp. TaxID=1884585 RepID=UPI003562BD13
MSQLISDFLIQVNEQKVPYVHCKNNANIERALSGDSDLHLLFEHGRKEEVKSIFALLNIVAVDSYKDNCQSEIKNYIGFDTALNKLIHFHVYFKLSVGYDFDNNYLLPIENSYLKSRYKYKNIYLPRIENEYILSVVRLILRNGLLPFSLYTLSNKIKMWKHSKKTGVIIGPDYKEFQFLEKKINRDQVKKLLECDFCFINQELFADCERVVKNNNSLKSYFKASLALKAAFKSMRDNGITKSYLLSLIRISQSRYKNLLRKIFKYNSFTYVPRNGGRAFAFVGADEAEKSTTIDLLKDTLSKYFKVQVIHIERPNRSFLGTILKIPIKISNRVMPNDMNLALSYLALAVDRLSEFRRACKLRENGYIVLLDRIPLKGITGVDSPGIRVNIGTKFEFLSHLEEAIYQKINGVDELFILKSAHDIALFRQPESEANELRFSSEQISNNDWQPPYAKVIDTGITNVKELQGEILNFINKSLCKKYDFIEIIGLNGTGKSTLTNEIKNKHANVTSAIPLKKYKLFLFLSALISIPWFFKAYLKTKSLEVSKNVMRLFTSIMIIEYWKFTSYNPASNFILDQGPFFQIAVLRKENILKSDLCEKLVNSYIKNIIYLSAEHEILWQRVKNRKNQPCRSQKMNKIEFIDFCSRYSRAFNSLSSHNIKRVDTTNISTLELLNVLKGEGIICK